MSTATDYVKLTEDRHQQALYRLAAVAQYLYDTMNGDAESDRDTKDPLPQMSMEKVREAQALIDEAIKQGQRTRRKCLGGDLRLVERPPRPIAKPKTLTVGRLRFAWVGRPEGWHLRRRRMGGIDIGLGAGCLFAFTLETSRKEGGT